MIDQDLYIVPLAYAQERLWLVDRLAPGSPALNLPALVALEGSLEIGTLRRALLEIVRRHESLRTTFAVLDGKPHQVIHAELGGELPVVDLCGLPVRAREGLAERLVREEALRPFDLLRGPLLRTVLLRQEERRHLLILTLHHAIADGWSLGILIREVSALYSAHAAGKPAALPALPIQYADYACWQREQLAGDVLEEQLAYWRRTLADLPPPELLALDHPRSASGLTGRTRSGSLVSELPAAVSAALLQLARRERCTPFVLLLAAFMVLLHRLSNRDDLTVGSPVAGRNASEVEHLVGVFLNTLVLRVDLSREPTFSALLARVRERVNGALTHQEVPFEKLIEDLQPERGGTPFFQVFFNMLSFPRGDLALPGLQAQYLVVPESAAKFDLEIYAEERPEGLRFRWVYDATLFDSGRIGEMRAQYELLLQEIAKRPAESIATYSLVTAEASGVLPDPRVVLDARWVGPVQAALTRQAERVSDRVAVLDRDGAWTYGQLAARTNQLAWHLVEAGIGRGDRVALYGHRDKDLVAAVLGVLKAGAAFTILEPAYPAERQVTCLRQAAPRGWITLRAAGAPPPELEAFFAASPPLVRLDLGGESGPLDERSAAPPPITLGPDDLAYVAFTSGSTGEPKGILGRHGPLSHFLPWQGERFGLTEFDRYSMLSGLAHDPLQRDIFTPLWFGATSCIPDPGRMAAPGWLSGWMASQEISVSHLTPAMGRLIVDTAPPGLRLGSLERAFFVGEALTWRDHTQLRQLAPRVSCVNLYGATETQRAVGFHELPDHAGGGELAVLPLGKGMQDVQLLLLNRGGGLAGIGEAGEIHVRSPHLARGYLGRPQLTAERFLANPLTGDPEDRVYRTGDQGRYLPDGSVQFLGRADDQIQVRGFRVEPAEVQSALARHPEIRQAVVVAWGEGLVERRLVAYVVPVAPPGPPVRELRSFLRGLLPEYMVPATILRLAQLPLQPNGKIERRALPSPDTTDGGGDDAFIAPRTPMEEIMAALWSQLLGVESVGSQDGFFDLGGHSLLATQLVARLGEILGIPVPLRLVFDSPGLAAQARDLEALRWGEPVGEVVPIRPAPRTGELPLSFAQERLWFLDQLAPGGALYNLPAAMQLEGALSIPALQAALDEIVRRHESLRTCFARGSAGAIQKIQVAAGLALPIVDLEALPGDLLEITARRLAAEEARRPFDLASGLLVRAALLRLGPERHVALLTLHHVISDRWSASVLFRELCLLYGAHSECRPSPLPELPIQYADYAVWQRSWLKGEVLESQLAYWERQLAGMPEELALVTDHPRPEGTALHGAVERGEIPAELCVQLAELGRRHDCTLFMVLVAGFLVVLHHLTGQEDLVVGTDVANRTRVEAESLIGFFVNQLVLRGDLSGDPPFQLLLRRVREMTLAAFVHQDVPFQHLVERLRPERGSAPLFRVKLNLHNIPESRAEVSGLAMHLLEVDRGSAQLDLIVNLTVAGQGLHIRSEYSTDLFKPETIQRMLHQLLSVLRWVIDRPSAPLTLLRAELARGDREQQAMVEKALDGISLGVLRNTNRKAVVADRGEVTL